MQKASPVEIRAGLEMANQLARAGIRFVAVPATTDEELAKLVALTDHRLELLAQAAEKEEKSNAKD